jgi:hypothetical protein
MAAYHWLLGTGTIVGEQKANVNARRFAALPSSDEGARLSRFLPRFVRKSTDF